MNKQIVKEDPRLISYNTLRKTIGWLGISLPLAMIIGNYIFGNCHTLQDSNSHYYYTVTGNLFTGILCAVGMFLIAYRGIDDDHNYTFFAGVCAIMIAMLPTNNNSADTCAIIDLPLNKWRNIAHYSFAALFFISLAWISLFIFTKSKGPKTKQKEKRNKVYLACGIIILVAITILFLISFFDVDRKYDKYKPTFWMEWVALIAFGASWLVKGELILKDKTSE